MATKPVSFRLDPHLYDCFADRCKQLGFPTVSDYFKSLGRYDLLISRPHRVTGELHKMSPDQQAIFDQRLAKDYIEGTTAGGSLMERMIAKAVEALGLPGNESIDEIAERVKEMLKKPKSMEGQ